jgi:hypothetical protein
MVNWKMIIGIGNFTISVICGKFRNDLSTPIQVTTDND